MKYYYWIIGLLSAAVLAAEISLTRVFAYLIWYHGVFLILLMAMLGFAASGALLTLGGEWIRKRTLGTIRAGIILFAFFLTVGIILPAFIPLNLQKVSLNNPSQIIYLLIYFIFWGLAFLCSGGAIALIIQKGREQIHRLYFVSLLGSGLGCLAAIGLLYLGPKVSLGIMALLSLAAALLVPGRMRKLSKIATGTILIASIVISSGIIPVPWQVDRSKQEFHNLASRTIELTRWSPISVVQIFSGEHEHWRYWDTGLAIQARDLKRFPVQKGIIIDAYAMSAFNQWDGKDLSSFSFFKQASTSSVYNLVPDPNQVLVIGIGGGIDLLRALYFGAESVTGVELNGILVDLLRGPYREFSGNLAFHPKVNIIKDEGRSYVKHSQKQFDIIQINYTDTWSASSAGALSLAENFLYTSEAIQDYCRRLSDRGVLSLTRTLENPGRENLRLTLTILKALREMGLSEPRRHLITVVSIMADSPNPHMSATSLVSTHPFTTAQVEEVMAAGKGNWVILIRPDEGELPPLTKADAPLSKNQLNNAREKMETSRSLYAEFLQDFPGTTVLDNYLFDVSPLTDDRPFYYFFYHWEEVWKHFRAGAFSIDAGGPFLLLALGLALSGSILGIFIPLGLWQWRNRKTREKTPRINIGWYGLYFLGLGLGFILVELNMMQKYALYLGHPIYAMGTVLGGLLILSGIGSFISTKIVWRSGTIAILFGGLIILLFIVMALPPLLLNIFSGQPLWLRAISSLIVITPLGVLMGMPFPLGLKHAGNSRSALIPWMWGVNGFGSVLGSVLATIIALAIGYHAVTLTAAISYLLAAGGGIMIHKHQKNLQ